MTKIANKVSYEIKSQIVGTDYFPITNSQSNIDGMALGDTKSASFDQVKSFILAGFNPETGGQLKITEFFVKDVPDVIADVVNAFDPPYVVAPYEMVWVKINSHAYLLKLTNLTIGVGQTPLSKDDFVEFTTSAGPAGNGISHITKTSTSGLVDTYTVTYTDTTTSTFTVTNGTNGTNGSNGTNGTNGNDGFNADVTRISTASATLGNTGSKTLTYASSSNLGWSVGTRLRMFHDSVNYMEGVITSVSSTSVTITADYNQGSGTYSSWTISIAGDLGTYANPAWLKYDVKEIDIDMTADPSYLVNNFDITGLGIGQRTGWAICNGNNGTKNRNGRFPLGYDPVNYATLGALGGYKNAVLIAHDHTVSPTQNPTYGAGGAVRTTWGPSAGDTGAAGDTVPLITSTAGGTEDGVGKNMPPYIVTLYIQKI